MGILPDSTIRADDFAITAVAGEALSTRDAVYIDPSDGKAYKCDADDLLKIGFAGFVISGVALGVTAHILPEGILGGFSGLTPGAFYYLSTTAGAITATKPSNYKVVAKALSATAIKIYTEPTVRVRSYTTVYVDLGSSTTQYDITNPSGTTFRYTWDGTGTTPAITGSNPAPGAIVNIQAQNFNAANKGVFTVTASGVNYFEVTNASGVAENDRTVGTGFIRISSLWTKPAGLVRVKVQVQAGGGGSGRSSNSQTGSGGGGGYTEGMFEASELAATELISVGPGGPGGNATLTSGQTGGVSSFGTLLVANGGAGSAQNGGPGAGGTVPTPGYFSVPGGSGSSAIDNDDGSTQSRHDYYCPGMGYLSEWVPPSTIGCNDCDKYGPVGRGYGYGGRALGQDSQPSAINGDTGGQGIVIVTEYY